MEGCIFCKIINREIPTSFIYQDDKFSVFNDIKPVAPVHILLVPKKHISSVDDLQPEDKELIGELILLARDVAQRQGLGGAYKLVFNVGSDGGQVIFHLHLHMIGGWKSKEERQTPGMP